MLVNNLHFLIYIFNLILFPNFKPSFNIYLSQSCSFNYLLMNYYLTLMISYQYHKNLISVHLRLKKPKMDLIHSLNYLYYFKIHLSLYH